MSARVPVTLHVVRAGGFPLARAVVLAMLAALVPAVALAQTPTWEMLPPIRPYSIDPEGGVSAIDFLYGEGAAADDPAADSLVAFGRYGVHLFNPSDAGGAAGENADQAGDWGAWHRLCTSAGTNCGTVADGLVTAAGSIVIGTQSLSRATNRGRSWQYGIEDFGPFPFLESSLPSLVGPTGAPGILVGAGDDGLAVRSLEDGAPGTWFDIGTGFGYPQALGEVPPSPSLPGGRILYGVWNGVVYSDDGGLSFTPSNAYGQAAYIAYSFTFLPVEGHPYGGVAYAGLENVALYPAPAAEVHRSDDGGATWTLAYRFTAEETGQPEINSHNVVQAVLYVTPDGVLWSGVSLRNGLAGPNRGGIMRSLDGGATWARADAGFAGSDGRGYRVNQLRLGRDGRLYAATERGVWRTTQAVVSSEGGPSVPESGVSLSVRPNPSSGRATVTLSLASASAVRVVVVDALGREVAVVLTGARPAGAHSAAVDARLAPGVYVVRASDASGRVLATTRLTVAR